MLLQIFTLELFSTNGSLKLGLLAAFVAHVSLQRISKPFVKFCQKTPSTSDDRLPSCSGQLEKMLAGTLLQSFELFVFSLSNIYQ